MATIIITLVLNLLIGTPADTAKDKNDNDKKPTTENSIKANGGSGAWTNVEK